MDSGDTAALGIVAGAAIGRYATGENAGALLGAGAGFAIGTQLGSDESAE